MHFVPENGTYVMVRYSNEKAVMVIFNKNETESSLELNRFKEVWPTQAKAMNVITEEALNLNAVYKVPAKSVTILQTTRRSH